MKVYIVQFDWSVQDDSNVELYVYDSYEKAYDKFKELIRNERNSEMSWVGDVEFDDEGYPIDECYDFDFEDNNTCESDLWWHIAGKDSLSEFASYIDLIVKEVL